MLVKIVLCTGHLNFDPIRDSEQLQVKSVHAGIPQPMRHTMANRMKTSSEPNTLLTKPLV
jgi:hypothetical protein